MESVVDTKMLTQGLNEVRMDLIHRARQAREDAEIALHGGAHIEPDAARAQVFATLALAYETAAANVMQEVERAEASSHVKLRITEMP